VWDRATSAFLCKRLRLDDERDSIRGILRHSTRQKARISRRQSRVSAVRPKELPRTRRPFATRYFFRKIAWVWISWPKKSSKVPTTITEDAIRGLALPLGLVDIKVCAVDDTWSGLKLVIRKELR
jgi:hypothetical protein